MPTEKSEDAELKRLIDEGYIIDEDRPDQFVPDRLPTQSPDLAPMPRVRRGYEHRKRRRR